MDLCKFKASLVCLARNSQSCMVRTLPQKREREGGREGGREEEKTGLYISSR